MVNDLQNNRVYKLLEEVSLQLHQLEEDGDILTKEEDKLWLNLTQLMVDLETQECNDIERLNWLQAQTKGYGKGWIVRNSLQGRGMRLHETGNADTSSTVREAIDLAMKQGV